MVKKHIILRKRASPKVVNLPNGRSFVSKWERISRKQLPMNIKVSRTRTIGPRRNNIMIYLNQAAPAFRKIKGRQKQQAGSGLSLNFIKAGFDLGSKVLGSEFGKKLINKGIDNILNIVKFWASKIRNKNVQRAVNSETADMIVNEAQGRVRKKYNSSDLLG